MSLFRNVVWFVKGMREYTKSGYLSASRDFDDKEIDIDCSQRSFIITGANSGIGKVTALEIARRGGTVHMVCRDEGRGERAKEEIVEETGNSKIHLHIVDMSRPAEILSFADKFKQSGQSLNVLVNNAGCMVNTRQLTGDGIEYNFATNTLGMHVLTTSLIPLLKEAQFPRVITVSSGGMLVQKLNVDDLQSEKMNPFDGTMVYAQNKRQQVVMTQLYAKTFPEIHFSCMHPGWADTPAVRSSMPDFYEKMKDKLRTAEQGADTLVWLSVSPRAAMFESGQFFQDRVPVAIHLPLAWTKSSTSEEQSLFTALDRFKDQFTCDL